MSKTKRLRTVVEDGGNEDDLELLMDPNNQLVLAGQLNIKSERVDTSQSEIDLSGSSGLNMAFGSTATDLYSTRDDTTVTEPEDDDESKDDTFFRLDNRTYQCKLCPEIFRHLLQIQKHTKVKHPAKWKSFKCVHCKRRFLSGPMRDRHVHFHSLNHPFRCTECDQMFRSKKRLEKHFEVFHYRNSHRFSMDRYHCGACELTFVEKNYYDLHSRIYHEGKPQRLKNLSNKIQVCDKCVKIFDSRDLLMEHIRETHQGDPPLKNCICQTCSKDLKTVTLLKIHILVVHMGIMPFVCQHCNAEFSSRNWLLKHLEKEHSESALFKCPTCDESFTTEARMIEHKEKFHAQQEIEFDPQTGKQVYPCGKCEKKLESKDLLNKHQLKAHPSFMMIYKCPLCPQSVQYRKQHMRVHHDVEYDDKEHSYQVRYKCHCCSKLFQQKGNLLSHQNSLSNQCRRCQMRFKTKEDQKAHMAAHRKNRRSLKCEDCGLDFGYRGRLEEHRKQYHSATSTQVLKIINCPYCPKLFIRPVNLQHHIAANHVQSEFIVNCGHCPVQVTDTAQLRKHYKTVHPEERLTFKCPECEKFYLDLYRFKEHYKKHKKEDEAGAKEGIKSTSEAVEGGEKENGQMHDQNTSGALESIVIKEETVVQIGNTAGPEESAATGIEDNSLNASEPSLEEMKIEIKQEKLDNEEAATSKDQTEGQKSMVAEETVAVQEQKADLVEVKEEFQTSTVESVAVEQPGPSVEQQTASEAKSVLLTAEELKQEEKMMVEETIVKSAVETKPAELKLEPATGKEPLNPEEKTTVEEMTTQEEPVNKSETAEAKPEQAIAPENVVLSENPNLSDAALVESCSSKEENSERVDPSIAEKMDMENKERIAQHQLKPHLSFMMIYKCPLCPQSVRCRKQHMRVHHDVEYDYKEHSYQVRYKCHCCSKLFQQKRYLLAHHQNSLSNQCSRCQMRFKTKEDLKAHMAAHRKNRRSFKCEDCGLEFAYRGRMEEHRKQYHSATSTQVLKIINCPYCPKLFIRPVNRQHHIAANHLQSEFIVNCGHCPVQVTDTAQLRTHYKTVHPEERLTFKCPGCEKFYLHLFNFKEHYKTHKKEDEAGAKEGINSTSEAVEGGEKENSQMHDQNASGALESIVIKEETVVDSPYTIVETSNEASEVSESSAVSERSTKPKIAGDRRRISTRNVLKRKKKLVVLLEPVDIDKLMELSRGSSSSSSPSLDRVAMKGSSGSSSESQPAEDAVRAKRLRRTPTSDTVAGDSLMDPNNQLNIKSEPVDTSQSAIDLSESSVLNMTFDSAATDLYSTRDDTTTNEVTTATEPEDHHEGDDESEDDTFFRLDNQTYQCKFCPEIYHYLLQIRKHTKVQHPAEWKSFKCFHCKRRFPSVPMRDRHGHFHSLNHPFKCTECDQMYRSKKRLEKHFEVFHNRNSHSFSMDRFHCGECELTFVEKNYYDLHSRIYHERKPQRLKNLSDKIQVCEKCVKIFDSRDLLMEHMRETHQGDPPLKNCICQTCSKDLKTMTLLKIHILVVHMGIMPFVCQHCNAEFSSRNWLLKHLEKEHSHSALFKCPTCDKSFTTEARMIKHKDKFHAQQEIEFDPQTGKQLYPCGKCEKKLESKDLLDKHQLKAHPSFMAAHRNNRSLKCEDCGLDFDYRGRLEEHQKQYHSATSTQVLKIINCPYCPKLFISPSIRQRHITANHIQSEFNCGHCPVQVTDTAQLRKHYKTVHPEERLTFKCPGCEKFYLKLSSFKDHYKKHKKEDGGGAKEGMNSTSEAVEGGEKENGQMHDQNTSGALESIVIKEETVVQIGNTASLEESAATGIEDNSLNAGEPSVEEMKIVIKQEKLDNEEAATSKDQTEWQKSMFAVETGGAGAEG